MTAAAARGGDRRLYGADDYSDLDDDYSEDEESDPKDEYLDFKRELGATGSRGFTFNRLRHHESKSERKQWTAIKGQRSRANVLTQNRSHRLAPKVPDFGQTKRSLGRAVYKACVEAREFRLARECSMHTTVQPGHLEELVAVYERAGEQGWLIKMLKQGLGLKGAHARIFTELGVLHLRFLCNSLELMAVLFKTNAFGSSLELMDALFKTNAKPNATNKVTD